MGQTARLQEVLCFQYRQQDQDLITILGGFLIPQIQTMGQLKPTLALGVAFRQLLILVGIKDLQDFGFGLVKENKK